MKDIEIRPATKADAEAISALNREVQGIHAKAIPWRFKEPGPDTFPREEVEALISRPDSLVLVAYLELSPVGYVYAEIVRKPESSTHYAYNAIYVHHISISTARRRRGVGTKLLECVEETARDLGIATVALDVWNFNREARTFFAGTGLRPYNERLWKRL